MTPHRRALALLSAGAVVLGLMVAIGDTGREASAHVAAPHKPATDPATRSGGCADASCGTSEQRGPDDRLRRDDPDLRVDRSALVHRQDPLCPRVRAAPAFGQLPVHALRGGLHDLPAEVPLHRCCSLRAYRARAVLGRRAVRLELRRRFHLGPADASGRDAVHRYVQGFSTGISNGAQMSSLLGCRLSTRIAAIAPVEGEEYLAPCNGRPEPILAFHGTADTVLPYTGGGLNATTIARLYAWHGAIPPNMPAPLGIDASMKLWAKHNGCNPQPVEVRVAFDVQRRTWTGCKATTVLYIVDGGGHGWPGKPVPSIGETVWARHDVDRRVETTVRLLLRPPDTLTPPRSIGGSGSGLLRCEYCFR